MVITPLLIRLDKKIIRFLTFSAQHCLRGTTVVHQKACCFLCLDSPWYHQGLTRAGCYTTHRQDARVVEGRKAGGCKGWLFLSFSFLSLPYLNDPG